jgi:hypothetical protein
MRRHGLVENRLSIFRSRDWKAIKALACDPAIFRHISDDYTSDPAKWEPMQSEQICYLLAADDSGLFGFGIFMPTNWVCYSVHLAFLPRSYGARSLAHFKQMIEWMWKHTKAARIVGEIDIDNRRAIRFARAAGFVSYGINAKSIQRGGILHDQVALGISRP